MNRQRKTVAAKQKTPVAPAAPTAAALRDLARVMCPPVSDPGSRVVLVPASRAELSADEARALALPYVEAVVARTASWGTPGTDWRIGDFRFLVLEFSPRKGAGIYVQFWTEPGDVVDLEACSGIPTPAIRTFIKAPQRNALEARGYKIGGGAQNYVKSWPNRTPADRRRLARELVNLLVDVYGYRGRQPVVAHYCSSTRTTLERTFVGMVLDDIRSLAMLAGYDVRRSRVGQEPQPEGVPLEEARAKTPPFLVARKPFRLLIDPVLADNNEPTRYHGVRLFTPLGAATGLEDVDIVQMNVAMPCGRIERDRDGDLALVVELWLKGVTEGWFISMMKEWGPLRKLALKLLRTARKARGPAADPNVVVSDQDVAELEDLATKSARARVVVH